MHSIQTRLLPLVSTLLLLPAALHAQPTAKEGDFQVNSYTTGYQYGPDVAFDGEGNFVVVWGSEGSTTADTDGYSVLAQRFAADGSAIGDEILVNSDTTGDQNHPQVDVNASGEFVVVWNTDAGPGDALLGIRARRFSADGSALGAEIQVNSYTTGYQQEPGVAVQDDGTFLVSWTSNIVAFNNGNLRVRRFDADGTAIGGELQVDTEVLNGDPPATAARPDGSFVVAWAKQLSIYAALFDSAGAMAGAAFEVNAYTTRAKFEPSIAVDAGGGFVVAWSSDGSLDTDTDDLSAHFRRFDSSGTAVTDEIQANTDTTGYQVQTQVAVLDNGDALVVWTTETTDVADKDNLRAAYFASDGSPIGAEFQVNSYTTSFQYGASVASDGEGRFVVAWSSQGSAASDTNAGSVQARRLSLDVGGQVFLDQDFDGLRDVGESAVDGVTVSLLDADDDSLLDSTVTDSSGTYVFEGRGLDYRLEFEAPLPYVFTFQDRGSDDSVDSDVEPDTGLTVDFTVALSPTWDAGLTNGVGDRVWHDADGDGVQDGSESGVSGVTVRLLEDGVGEVATDATDADGRYSFADLSPGIYYVEVVAPAGFVFTAQKQGDDADLDSDVDVVSGASSPFVFTYGTLDTGLDAGLETDGDDDAVADRVDNCPSDANADQADADGDGVGDACDTSLLGNRVWLDDGDGLQAGGEPGVENVTVNLYDDTDTLVGTTTTDADGKYSFSPGPGDYYLEVLLPADTAFAPRDQGIDDALDSDLFAQSGTTAVLSLLAGQTDTTRDAGLEPATIGNLVWLDANGDGLRQPGETGLAGLTVRLLDAADQVVAATVTDAGGIYGFLGVGSGSYRLEIVLPTDAVFSSQDVGSDDLIDSDVDPATSRTELFAYTAGSASRRWDAGLRLLAFFADGFESGDKTAWSSSVP